MSYPPTCPLCGGALGPVEDAIEAEPDTGQRHVRAHRACGECGEMVEETPVEVEDLT